MIVQLNKSKLVGKAKNSFQFNKSFSTTITHHNTRLSNEMDKKAYAAHGNIVVT